MTSSPDKFKYKEKFDKKIADANGTPSLSYKSFHILVRDITFQTSSGALGSQIVFPNARQRPQCSAKSMYALATKLGLNQLCDHAFAFIRENLNENNILQEVSCGFVGSGMIGYPDVLEFGLGSP
ncbi:hypothetical protein EDC04DRAFT_1844463 [Pisolithus marmoratus]|nr:hypothetical protein EDC04DRAFT_1844463 [Pisolithus marmoratus]